jgi:putative GTP pyrophosphokinase
MSQKKGSAPNRANNVEAILSEFNSKKELLTRLCDKTKILVEDLLSEPSLRYQSIQARVKSDMKLKEKFLDPSKNYRKLDDITDQAGLRIITYYEDEVDLVADLIAREFNIDSDNSVDRRKRNQQDERFGYHAVNFVCKYTDTRLSQTEYKKFRGIHFEIQITSILRHAWAEIEHGWYDLDESYPAEIKRRFSRMAALLEIAESEFSNLKKEQNSYQRSIAVRVEADVSDVPINAVSINSFIEQYSRGQSIDRALAKALDAPGLKKASSRLVGRFTAAVIFPGFKTIAELRDAVELYQSETIKYASLVKNIYTIPANVPLNKGAFIFRLAFWLSAKDGDEKLAGFLETYGVLEDYSRAEIKSLVDIARTVQSKPKSATTTRRPILRQ